MGVLYAIGRVRDAGTINGGTSAASHRNAAHVQKVSTGGALLVWVAYAVLLNVGGANTLGEGRGRPMGTRLHYLDNLDQKPQFLFFFRRQGISQEVTSNLNCPPLLHAQLWQLKSSQWRFQYMQAVSQINTKAMNCESNSWS